ncbi:hypothetical protein F5B20DRAFT_369828 [Whalleya microplaca]|nr:hypothetical protein F5B20DRAFT_369828 [Whalleya microplaca]
MAEALAAVGAVASIVQLGDTALRLCRSISDFLREWKDVKDNVRHLRSTLDDISSLMRSLIAYIVEFYNPISRRASHEALLEIVVKRFAEHLDSLRKCLPSDLSPSFAQKFRFVFDKKRIKSITKQFEACKSIALFALMVMGHVDNVSFENDMRKLLVISLSISEKQEAAMRMSVQQGSQIMSAIQKISRQQTQALPMVEHLNKGHQEFAAQLIPSIQEISQRQAQTLPSLAQVEKRTMELASAMESTHSMMKAQF